MSNDLSTDLPIVDLDVYRAGPPDSEAAIKECKKVRLSLSLDTSLTEGI